MFLRSIKSFVKYFLIAILFTLLCQGVAIAQSRSSLENKRKKLLKEIKLTSELLSNTQKNRKSSVIALQTLNKQIETRDKLIQNISDQIDFLDEHINRNNSVIESLERDLQKFKEEYAKMIYYAYKTRNAYSKLLFIFSSETFNDAFRRIKYLQRYADHRKRQVELIDLTKKSLSKQVEKLEERKQEKKALLDSETEQKQLLSGEKQKKNDLIKTLKKKESSLLADIKKKKRDAEKLNKAIEDIIKKEIELARKKAEASKNAMTLTPEAAKLSKDFVANKGKFPWPVERGVIIGTFGEHPHPVLPSVKVKNNGVDIKSPKGSIARAVFDGEVVNIVYNPGFNNAIIVKHGEYFSVYSNIDKTFVKAGDKLSPKQDLGTVYTDDDGLTQIHFEIWQGTKKLNPAYWLAR